MSRSPNRHASLSLFTGAGGLDLGLEAAGFETAGCVEIDPDARRSLTKNRPEWLLATPGDIHQLDPHHLLKQASLKPRQLALLAGGPPCQPFSKSSYWTNGDARRLKDPRAQTLHAYLEVVAAALPHVLMLENVKGLAYEGKDEGLRLLRAGLKSINRKHRTSYEFQIVSLNAADYGVPQVRERVFVFACIDGTQLELPEPTHGDAYGCQSVLTAWDAIGHLDSRTWPQELDATGRWARLLPSIPEGANYLWHTPRNADNGGEPLFGWRTRFWSFLLKLAKNLPSWTVQADPGPATGPFHWRSRLLSGEELCRLQTFPSGYEIVGNRRSIYRQLGNAVPSAIGELLGLEVRRQFFGERVRRTLKLLPARRDDCPKPERVAPVPPAYLRNRAQHDDHPGTGLGPAARRRGQAEAGA